MALVARLTTRHVGCLVSECLTDGAQAAHVSTDWNADVVVLQASRPEQVAAFLENVRRTQEHPPVIVSQGPLSLVLRLRTPKDGVFAAIMRAKVSVLWPAIWHDGLEKYHVLAKDRRELDQAVRELRKAGPVTVEEIADVEPGTIAVSAPLSHLVAGLTQRQLKAFRVAVQGGYYETPRRESTRTLAARLAVTRTTFEEHLRKAERRVFPRVAAIIDAHPGLAESAKGGPGRPRKRPRSEGKRQG